jgi:uncharacterized protein (TIGR03663 family)
MFGLGLVLLPLVIRKALGWKATLWAMGLCAVSPCMAFYSRYYIQETLLVFFTFGLIVCAWRYVQDRRPVWAGLAGACAGLMYATKETAIIAWGCLGLAGLVTWAWQRSRQGGHGAAIRVPLRDLALGGGAAILVWVLLYSSFFTHPKGVVDSVRTLAVYLNRAGAGNHVHPWTYYLDLLTWLRIWERPAWNEDFIVLMACVGVGCLVLRRPVRTCAPGLAVLLAVYTVAMAVVYSAIPYKTPWCMMGFVHGMTLVSAIAVSELCARARSWRIGAMCTAAALGLGIVGPLAQAYLLNFRYASALANPYVYAHTSKDVLHVVAKVRQVAAASPKGKALLIQVISPGADYWPFPWYLRDFTAVGFYQAVDFNAPPGDLILAKPQVEPDVIRWLYEVPPPGSRHLYVSFLDPGTRLRPGVELRGYVRSDLWDAVTDPAR